LKGPFQIVPKLGLIEPNLGMIIAMGAKAKSRTASSRHDVGRIGLADALFSGTQQRVLGIIFGQPERSFYANEVIALAHSGSGAVQRELARLAQSELVDVRELGNQKHYQANPRSPIYTELCGIANKTMGLAGPLRTALGPLMDHIHAAFIYGSVAKRQDTASSDVDLMIVSDDVTYADVFTLLEEASHTVGRTVNPTIYNSAELAKRISRGDAFIKRVLAQPKIWLIGDENVLAA
jgi:predicted nucleotidyltransferase